MIDFEAGTTQEFPNIALSNKGKIKERVVASVFYRAVVEDAPCISRSSGNKGKNDDKTK